MIRVVVSLGEQLQQFGVAADGEERAVQFVIHGGKSAQEDGHGNRALAVEAQRQIARFARLELHPHAAIGDQLGRRQAVPAVIFHAEIDAGRTDQLAHHHALRPVDDECGALGHLRKIAQENLLLDDLAGLAIDQGDIHVQRHCVGEVTIQTLFLAVFGFAKTITEVELGLFRFVARQIQTQQTIETFNW